MILLVVVLPALTMLSVWSFPLTAYYPKWSEEEKPVRHDATISATNASPPLHNTSQNNNEQFFASTTDESIAEPEQTNQSHSTTKVPSLATFNEPEPHKHVNKSMGTLLSKPPSNATLPQRQKAQSRLSTDNNSTSTSTRFDAENSSTSLFWSLLDKDSCSRDLNVSFVRLRQNATDSDWFCDRKKDCSCFSPLQAVAQPAPNGTVAWPYERNRQWARGDNTSVTNPDVVFLGDSIVEQMCGQRFGKYKPRTIEVGQHFQRLFGGPHEEEGGTNKNKTTNLTALPLGIAEATVCHAYLVFIRCARFEANALLVCSESRRMGCFIVCRTENGRIG